MAITVTSISVRGLNSPFKRNAFRRETVRLGCDIIFAQETHLKEADTYRCSHHKFPHSWFSSTNKKKGVLIAFKDSVSFTTHAIEIDPLDRYIILVCEINNQYFILMSTYLIPTKLEH